MSYIDFEELKARVSIEDAVALLQLDLKKSNNQLRGPCPACGTGGERALVVTPAKGVYYCFAEKKGGDSISLVAHIRNIGMKESAQYLSEQFSTVPQRNEPKETKKLQALSYLEHDHDAVIAVGFEPEDAQALGIGYASKGIMRGTVAVPIRMEDGTLVGYIGVTEATLPKSFDLPDRSNVIPLHKKQTA